MVNVTKGCLIRCDPAMKQFLLFLDEKQEFGTKFVIQDLDEKHLFVSREIVGTLRAQVHDLMDRFNTRATAQ